MIFAKASQRRIITPNIYSRALAFPLAIEVINQEIKKDSNIVVFSDDLSLLECFKKELPSLLKLTKIQREKLFFSDNLYSGNKGDFAYRALYENAIMSWANKIYCTKTSGYANLAILTGKYKEDIDVYEYFTLKEQSEIIKKYLKISNIHYFQKSFACFLAFQITRQLKMPLVESKKWLFEALRYNPHNCAFHILWLEILFKNKKLKEAEDYLSRIIGEYGQEFWETLFFDGVKSYSYDFIFRDFLLNAKTPSISLVAYHIALNLKLKNSAHFYRLPQSQIRFYSKKLLGAEFIMKNYLSYQLGEAIVKNSNSWLGRVMIPLKILQIYLMYRKSKIKHYLPLEKYADYQRAIKFVKSHIYYKIGLALIKAQKNWYKGGYFIFAKELIKISKEYKKR